MDLEKALFVLATTHTRDDSRTGFTVETHPAVEPIFSGAEYVEAWKAVREHLHWQVDPATPL